MPEKRPGAPSQLDKFKAAARELGTDDDPERFKETVRKIGAVKPKEADPESPPSGKPA